MLRSPVPPGLTLIVYRYAAKADLPPAAIAELRRAHRHGNAVVEIHMGYEEAKAAAWSAHPDIAAAERRRDEANELVIELTAQAKAARAGRAPRPDAALESRLKAARGAAETAKAQVRALKERHYAVCAPALAEAEQARAAAIKATYRPAIDGGLHWTTYNAVTSRYWTAAAQVANKRKAGQPAELFYRRWTGEGTLTVQLNRKAGHPARDPAMIASASGKWANAARLGPWDDPAEFAPLPQPERIRRGRRGVLRMRIGSGEHKAWITLPVMMHRMLPAAADITRIEVTRRTVAGHPQVTVAVTARVRAPATRVQGALVAVHTGRRALDDGSLRVAVVTGAGPPPAALTEERQWHSGHRGRRNRAGQPGPVVRRHGDWAEILIPAQWRELQRRHQRIRSRRDRDLNVIRARVLAWLDDHPGHREVIDPDGSLGRCRSPARFAALAARLAENPPDEAADLAGEVAAWERQDRYLWEREAFGRARLLRRRNEFWAIAAAWLTRDAAMVVVDKQDIASRARHPDAEQEDDPRARAARANLVLAAPGILRAAIANTARRRGAAVGEYQAAGPAAHAACGIPFGAGAATESVMAWCGECGVLVDRDWNTLQGIIKAVRG